ncbi:MAG: hypothetical protein U9N04_03675 [Patescibacteria group bacterium]|nr:hypothetical protein [Patescibacteria group bacterium]
MNGKIVFGSFAEYLDEMIRNQTRDLIEKNIPPSLKSLVPILGRVASKTVRKGELKLALRMMGILVVYEMRNTGYDIRDMRNGGYRTKNNEYETVWIWEDFSSKKFVIRKYDVTYPKQRAEEMKQNFEYLFLYLYGIEIKFDSPPQR